MRVIGRHLDVQFVEEERSGSHEIVEGSTEAGIEELAPELRARLEAALKIRNLTAIKKIAEALGDDPSTAAIGEQIMKLVRKFDFAQLQGLLDD